MEKLDWIERIVGKKPTESHCYNGVVNIDTKLGWNGVAFPIGTSSHPVNNIEDAITIAKDRGLQMVCDKCNGTGEPNNNKIDYSKRYIYFPTSCDKCHGSGKLDWVEVVVGKCKKNRRR